MLLLAFVWKLRGALDFFVHAREEGGISQKKSPMVVTGVNAFF